MKNQKLIEKIKKSGSAFGNFIDGKGFYIIIFLCVIVIGATITVVSLRDYNKIGNQYSSNEKLLNNATDINGKQSDEIYKETDVPARTVTASISEQPKQNKPRVVYGNKEGISQKSNKNKFERDTLKKLIKNKKSSDKNKNESLQPISPIYPVFGKIIKEYAQSNLVYSRTLQAWTTHTGIDIASELNTPVKASADGIVKSIKNDPGYGITITIEHSDGIKTIYSNLSTAAMVKPGKKVKRGTVISGIGSTAGFECLDQPHLHFEVKKDDKIFSPLNYLGSLN